MLLKSFEHIGARSIKGNYCYVNEETMMIKKSLSIPSWSKYWSKFSQTKLLAVFTHYFILSTCSIYI